jgi:hypothetical protein
MANTCPRCGKVLTSQGICAECAGARLGRDTLIGATIGDVKIESRIATGGMAVVYLGRQEHTNRKVAVKILRPERQLSYRDREYFAREAKALGKIRHPHLVELYGAGTTSDGRHYMILEFVPGRTLRQLVEEEGRLEPLRCLRLFRQLLLALEAVHATGILHRDLKPDNILVESLEGGKKERLRLADLGLVKFTSAKLPALTGHGMTVGTPCYMSPEQVRGKKLDERSDLYTVGVLLFEAMTSYLPYPEEKTVDSLLDHILDTRPAKLTRVDKRFKRMPGIQVLLDRLMAKRRKERPRTSADVIKIVDRLIETDLIGEVQAALDAEDDSAPGSGDTGFDYVSDGILIALVTTARDGGGGVAPPPDLLRRLRAFLDDAGVMAARRQGAQASFGFVRSDQSIRATRALPRLVEQVRDNFPDYAIGVGVAFGEFDVDKDGCPVDGPTLNDALRLAASAKDGQVLIPRQTAQEFGLRNEKT